MENKQTNGTVEAIILAGGKGTRLAPLTENTPKPMLSVLGRPVLSYVLDAAVKAGADKACVTTMYLPWQIESLTDIPEKLPVRFVREQYPLGTAGAVKNAYDGVSDTVLVLSGDGIFDFDLSAALSRHREKNAEVTVVTHHSEHPLEYGVVLTDADGKITAFSEKPPWAKVLSGSVNTGIYIIAREILDEIPDNTPFDFASMLFPLLMASGRALYAYEADGAWYDIGSLDEYFTANRACLDGTVGIAHADGVPSAKLIENGIECEEPIYVSPSAVIGKGVKLGAYSVIGRGAVISDGCDIACTVVGEGTVLGKGCGIYGTLFGRGCRLGENCVTGEGCVFGDGATVQDGTVLAKYAMVHSGASVSARDAQPARFGRRGRTVFGDDGIALEPTLPPEYYVRIGQSIAEAAVSEASASNRAYVRVGILHDGNENASRVYELISGGIRASGIKSYRFGLGFESLAPFAAASFGCDAVAWIEAHGSERICVRLYNAFGLPVGVSFERAADAAFFSSDDYVPPETFFVPEPFDGLLPCYETALKQKAARLLGEHGFVGVRAAFDDENGLPRTVSPIVTLRRVFNDLGGKVVPSGPTVPLISLSDGGLSARIEYHGAVADTAHLNAVMISHFPVIESPDAVLYLSGGAPEILRTIADCAHLHYKLYAPSGKSHALPREEFTKQSYFRDGLEAALCVSALCVRLGTNIEALLGQLPKFAVTSRRCDGITNRAGVMKSLAAVASSVSDDVHDGIRLVMSGGRATIIPGKLDGFRVISEATGAEAAGELCDKVFEMLKAAGEK